MRKLLLLLTILSIQTIRAQVPPFDWARGFGNAVNIYSAALAPTGELYLTGNFSGTADLDPTSGTASFTAQNQDAMLVKLDASGGFLWAKTWGGAGTDVATEVALDAAGAVLVAGHFTGTADFDPGAGTTSLTSAGVYDVFAMRLDASGAFSWAQRLGGTGTEFLKGAGVDAAGNLYLSGAIFNSSALVAWKLMGATGAVSWTREWATGGGNPQDGGDLAVDAAGNVYAMDMFGGARDFDPGAGTFTLTSAGQFDVAISKLDSAGNFIWAKRFGGTLDDRCSAIEVVPTGGLCFAGWFVGTSDFDPGAGTQALVSAGGYDVFVARIDTSGAYTSAVSFGGTTADENPRLAMDAAGAAYVAANFTGTADLDPGAGTTSFTSLGSSDAMLLKLDAQNAFMWGARIGSTGLDVPLAMAVNAAGLYMSAQYSDGPVDMNPGAGTSNLPLGENVVKLSFTGSPSTVRAAVMDGSSLVLFPNPAGDAVMLQSADYMRDARVRLIDARGVVVRAWDGLAGSTTLELRGLAAGVYVVEATGAAGVRRTWLVKQ